MTWADGRNLVNGYDIWGARIREDSGSWAVCASRSISTATANQSNPAASQNNTNAVAIWADHRNSVATGWDIYGSRVNQDSSGLCGVGGQLTISPNIPISNASGDQRFPAIASDQNRFLAAWQDKRPQFPFNANDDLFVARLNGDGSVIDANGIEIMNGPISYPVLAGGAVDRYLVAYQRDVGGVPRVKLRSLTSPWP